MADSCSVRSFASDAQAQRKSDPLFNLLEVTRCAPFGHSWDAVQSRSLPLRCWRARHRACARQSLRSLSPLLPPLGLPQSCPPPDPPPCGHCHCLHSPLPLQLLHSLQLPVQSHVLVRTHKEALKRTPVQSELCISRPISRGTGGDYSRVLCFVLGLVLLGFSGTTKASRS